MLIINLDKNLSSDKSVSLAELVSMLGENDNKLLFNEIEKNLEDLDTFKKSVEESSHEESFYDHCVLNNSFVLSKLDDYYQVIASSNDVKIDEIKSIVKEISVYLSKVQDSACDKFSIVLNNNMGLKEVSISKDKNNVVNISLFVNDSADMNNFLHLVNDLKSTLTECMSSKFVISTEKIPGVIAIDNVSKFDGKDELSGLNSSINSSGNVGCINKDVHHTSDVVRKDLEHKVLEVKSDINPDQSIKNLDQDIKSGFCVKNSELSQLAVDSAKDASSSSFGRGEESHDESGNNSSNSRHKHDFEEDSDLNE